MKNIIPFALCFGLLCVTSCNEDDSDPVTVNESICLPASLQDGLIAAYSFGNGSLNDLVGSAHLTSLNAQPGIDRQGNADCAYLFQGNADSYLTSQNTGFLNGLEEMTITLWYAKDVQEQGYKLLLGRGDAPLHCPDTFGEWSVGLYDGFRAVFGHGHSVWEQPNSTDNPQWKFLTATVKKSGNIVSIYINGVLQQTNEGLGCDPINQTIDDIGDLLIGRKFKGGIDDIAIYNRILSQSEITQLFEADPCCE